MTDSKHPITLPPELVEQWWDGTHGAFYEFEAVVTQAARWGADQELEACCKWFVRDWTDIETADKLRAARRPKPLSLKEQALAALKDAAEMANDIPPEGISTDQVDIIRRVLELLDD